ncbi:MAG: hypothetical protein ACXADU_00835 [Promethearchaeota archaeon]|jgi:hypothetical protein
MNPWKVLLKPSNGIERELELSDAKNYFGGYLKIQRGFFNGLIKSIKMTKKYFSYKAIDKVLGPNEDDWTLNPWMLIMIQDTEKKKTFWLFIKREKDLSGVLVAIGPKTYAEYNNRNLSEAKRELKLLINYLITYVNKFSCVVILPKYLP